MRLAFFITGTDTSIGKTYVMHHLIQQFLAAGERVLALKPIESGVESDRGSQETPIYQQAGLTAADCCTMHVFEPPIAPHLAAKLVDLHLSAADISAWCQQQMDGYSCVLIEGAGGLLVPLNAQETWVDVIRALSIPVIWVVGIRLGCINHALLTEQALMTSGCKIEGWIANFLDPSCLYPELVFETLHTTLQSPCLGQVSYQGVLSTRPPLKII